jgi:hypothetical protein
MRLNKKAIAAVAVVVVAVSLGAVVSFGPSLFSVEPEQQELDFTVTGSNECLRFLERKVKEVYVPFRTGANEQWLLTVECLEMPGQGGWTDLYFYEGYWDEGENHTCAAEDMYPILSDIPESTNCVGTESPYSEVFGGPEPQSRTVFFVYPPGGTATFHIKLEQLK